MVANSGFRAPGTTPAAERSRRPEWCVEVLGRSGAPVRQLGQDGLLSFFRLRLVCPFCPFCGA